MLALKKKKKTCFGLWLSPVCDQSVHPMFRSNTTSRFAGCNTPLSVTTNLILAPFLI